MLTKNQRNWFPPKSLPSKNPIFYFIIYFLVAPIKLAILSLATVDFNLLKGPEFIKTPSPV